MCCTSLRPEKEEKGETERNIRQTSLRNLFRAFSTLSTENGVPVYFKFSPRNFGFVPRLDCLPPPSPFYSLPRRHLVPTIFPHYPPNLLSIRAKRTNETTRRRFATRQKILRYFAGTIFLFYSDKTPLERGSRGRLKYLKKRGVVVQRRKARVRNKNTFERKFKVDYLAAQDYTLRPASLVISRDKRREERRETY